MTVNDLIRELSELDPIDRTLDVLGVECVTVFPARAVTLTIKKAERMREGRVGIAHG